MIADTPPKGKREKLRVIWAMVVGAPLSDVDREYGIEKAKRVSAKIPQGLLMGFLFSLLLTSSASSLFPLTPLNALLLVLAFIGGAMYIAGLAFSIRVWLWLRRNG